MPTKGLIDRERIGRDILHASRTHAREVGERLNESLRFTAEEGETFPDFIHFQHQLARLLESRLDALVAADDEHLGELDDDQEPRLLRRQAADALYTKLVEVRELLRGVFGFERANSLVGITGETPLDPVTLHRQGASALERLRAPDPELPPQRLSGLQLDRDALADELQPLVDELGRILEDVKREVREREITKRSRDRALADFDTTAGAVARIQIGLDDLAGFPEYSDRIRLTRSARSRSGPEDDEEPSEQPDPDDRPGPSEELGVTAADSSSAIGSQPPGDRILPAGKDGDDD